MGQWTVGYHDDVLGAKMKSLVAGALKRSKIDKIEPTISYETFVEELDGGDSFTTSLIDALVKELAERRTRQTTADRRLIADRTAKSLRMLALPSNIYRDRTLGRGLRRVNLTDYLTSPPEELDMEEDEGDEGYDGITGENGPSFIEGARVNSDLYDAYAAHGWSAHPMGPSLSRRSHANVSAAFSPPSDPSEASNSLDPVHPSLESRARDSNWFGSGTAFGGSTLSRQPSIRRPIRSRTVDFNDFATRRRSTFRNAVVDSDDPRSSEDIPNTLSSWGSGPTDEPLGSPGARRFFPFSRRRHEVAITAMPTWYDNGASTSRPVSPPELLTSRPRRSNSGPPPLITTVSLEEHRRMFGDQSPQLPRLRHGGLRAPESMLSRHASPANNGTDHSPPPIVISISREASAVTTPAAEAAEVPAPTVTPGPAEQS